MSADAASTTALLAPFVGVWSSTQEGCEKLKQGALDNMTTNRATQFGIVEVSTTGVKWVYTSGSMAVCSFAQGKTTTDGKKIIAPASCGEGGNHPSIIIVFSTISPTVQYVVGGSPSEDYTKIRCH